MPTRKSSTGEVSLWKGFYSQNTASRQIPSWGQALPLTDDRHREFILAPSLRRSNSSAAGFSHPRIFEKLSVPMDMRGKLPASFEELPISFEELPTEPNVFEELQVSFEGLPVATDVVDSWFAYLSQEAEDTGEPMPPESDVEEARRIVLRLRGQLPEDTDVYLMDGGKIAIEVYGDLGYAFLLVCEPGGSALCVVTVNGVSRRARYESSRTLPDSFIREGLNDVRPVAQGGYGFPAHW